MLDAYILRIEKELDVLVLDMNTTAVKLQVNLSSSQRNALHDLKCNNDIVNKPAYIGESIVITEKNFYMMETCTQHHDWRLYPKIYKDSTPTLMNKVLILIDELQPDLLNNVMKLIPSHPRPATFCTIIKVHILPNIVVLTCPRSNTDIAIVQAKRCNVDPPGWPMVSGICTSTEYVSAFVLQSLL